MIKNMFEIVFYANDKGVSEVKEWLKRLNLEAETNKNSRVNLKKIYLYLNLLRKNGTYVGEPCVKHIDGEIWELRPMQNRIFFFYKHEKTFVLLHYFVKKSQKTPKKEIEQAKRNMKDFLRRIK